MLLGAAIYSAYGQQSESEGRQPYSPTKIEWLALETQAYYGDHLYGEDAVTVFFYHHEPDTIEIHLRYRGRRDQRVELELRSAKTNVGYLARKHGWEDWVKITENVRRMSDESLPE
jgi:hypothetical protein